MDEPADRALDARVEAVADNIRVDAATAEVVDAFRARSIPARLLKGPSIARWLYADAEPRSYRDCDLLVAPDALAAAEATLQRLGFERQFDETRMPEWWREHASEWWRATDGVTVDLHRTLPDVGVGDDAVWQALSRDPESMKIGGVEVDVLPLSGRALHVALHAMHHGREWGTPLGDLERALECADDRVWRDAARLAEELGATDAFAVGLRLHPRGRAFASRLGLAGAGTVTSVLMASTPPPVALGIEQLSRAPGVRMRIVILARKLFPPREFVRHWHPIASRGPVGLVLAYVYRPVWLVRRTPTALRAWLAARRQVSRPEAAAPSTKADRRGASKRDRPHRRARPRG